MLAPDLFRVGIFPDGRTVNYYSDAVVARNWDAGSVSIEEGEEQLTVTTSGATAHISLDALRISFSDKAEGFLRQMIQLWVWAGSPQKMRGQMLIL